MVPTQYEWLKQRLEPIEVLELTRAHDAFMIQPWTEMIHGPLFWAEESECRDATISGHLLHGFVWRDSPQGKQYWQAVHDKYAAIEQKGT
jgi:hypothetical protein